MSDSTQQYILSKPVRIEKWVRTNTNLLGDTWTTTDYEIRLKPSDTTQRHPDRFSFSQATYEEFFQPLNIPAVEKQLEGHLASFIVNVTEYVDLCDHAQNAEELNAIRGHFKRCQHEHIAEVLRLFGLENKGSDK